MLSSEAKEMAEARLIRSDLPTAHRKPILDAVKKIYATFVTDSEDKKRSKLLRWGDFAKALRCSLDGSFGPSWHVLIGNSLGFACKKRHQTVGIWKIEDCMVVVWKSPGIEPPEQVATAAAASMLGTAKDSDDGSHLKEAKLQVLQPTEIEESQLHGIIASIRDEIPKAPADVQALAAALRRRLTADFGTIWHVVAGSEFVLDPADNRRNYVLATIGKTRIVAFQHEQHVGGRIWDRIEWGKIVASLPYLCMIVLCFGYMTLSSMCREDRDMSKSSARTKQLREMMCYQNWESDIGMLGVFAMGLLFIVKKTNFVKSRIKGD